MKKHLSLLLAVFMLFGLVVGVSSPSFAEESKVEIKDDTLYIGTTDMDGYYINGFTNSSYDVAIKELLGTYGETNYTTILSDPSGEFVLDKTVNAKDPESKMNEDGSKTYTFFINEGLLWSDGAPLNARDYVFAVLFAASPQWKVAGASTSAGDTLLGYEAYHNGESTSFPGIKLIDDYTFEITLAPEFVPYFFEFASVGASPTPMHRYTPNLTIGEDGCSLVVKPDYEVSDKDKTEFLSRVAEQVKTEEANLVKALESIDKDKADEGDAYPDADVAADKEKANKAAEEAIAALTELKTKAEAGEFDPREVLLQANAYEISQVFRYAPDVTCGPYKFVENKNKAVTLELNENFAGNYEGKKPTIKYIIQKTIPVKSDVDMALSGEIDIAVSVTDADLITKVREAADAGKLGFNSYPRAGFGMIRFLTDLGATAHKEVRQAIGYLLNRDLFIQNMYGGYGTVTDGYYSLNDWTYKEKGEEFEEQANHYTLNIEKANEVLNNSPYKFEADGTTPWDVAKAKAAFDQDAEHFEYWRHNDKGEKLIVNQAGGYPPIVELINQNIPQNGKLAGLQYNAVDVDFPTLLANLKKPDLENPKFTAFTLGVGMTPIFDPFYQFNSKQIGNDNQDRVNDPEADRITNEMRKLEPTDKETFAEYWLEFQLWFNDYLPELPLYSNEYYDAFTPRVKNLTTSPYWAWYKDICNITLEPKP